MLASPTAARSPAVPIAAVAETTNVILVHGAFADGSAWNKVIAKLEAQGFKARAVQLPETSLKADIDATKRMIAAAKGPVVLVGHSYGGVVITGAADGEASVKALVYVAALVPDTGEAGGELFAKYPTPGARQIIAHSGDYQWIEPSAFREAFCHDVPEADANVMAMTQKPINKNAFGAKLTGAAAWKKLPSWFVLTTEDRMVSPDLQRFEANRMGSTVIEVSSSHTPFLSHPDKVVDAIVAAAKGKTEVQRPS